jgi:hypothetical protein
MNMKNAECLHAEYFLSNIVFLNRAGYRLALISEVLRGTWHLKKHIQKGLGQPYLSTGKGIAAP